MSETPEIHALPYRMNPKCAVYECLCTVSGKTNCGAALSKGGVSYFCTRKAHHDGAHYSCGVVAKIWHDQKEPDSGKEGG